jgi:hypothetical protein
VAGFARSLECSFVRIGVAGDAGIEFYPRELHCLVGAGRKMALLAGHLGVHSGQRIFCFRMVELLGLFPVGHIVAALAIGAELPLVYVLMAGDAILREAQKGLREVLLLNQRALRGNHMRRRMALLARHGRVLFYQWISGLAMIELLERRLPMNERKILAIVLEVAPHTVPAIGILHPEKRVIALMRGQTVGYFLMAFQALERWRAGSELVTRVALRRAIEGLVRFRERSGRNLGAGAGSREQESTENQQRAEDQTHGDIDGADATARCSCTEKRHQVPPTNRLLRFHRRWLDPKLARAMFRQTYEPTSCASPTKLAERTGKG